MVNPQLKLKECPFCGNEPELYTQPNAGEGGAARHRIACFYCGTLSDFFDEFIHGRNAAETIQKAVKAWNRRARIARSEDLADHVGLLRSLLGTITQGCKAKTKAAQNAREACKAMSEAIDMILHHAKNFEVVPLDVNRAAR